MQKKKCNQCNKTFEAKRSDSIYCSSNCKQKAHQKRTLKKESIETENSEMNIFYLDEYQSIKWDGFDIITFCFLRRNLSCKISKEELMDYLNAILGVDEDWKVKYDSIRKTKAFSEFQEVYLSGSIKVYPKKST
jgi:hypothetical protein